MILAHDLVAGGRKQQKIEGKFLAHLKSSAINISGKLHFRSMRHCEDVVGVDLADKG